MVGIIPGVGALKDMAYTVLPSCVCEWVNGGAIYNKGVFGERQTLEEVYQMMLSSVSF